MSAADQVMQQQFEAGLVPLDMGTVWGAWAAQPEPEPDVDDELVDVGPAHRTEKVTKTVAVEQRVGSHVWVTERQVTVFRIVKPEPKPTHGFIGMPDPCEHVSRLALIGAKIRGGDELEELMDHLDGCQAR